MFDTWALFYDLPWLQRSLSRPPHDAVLAELRGARCRRILDVGCGTGQLVARLRHELHGLEVFGCDFSGGMLRQAQTRDPDAPWDEREIFFHDVPTEVTEAVYARGEPQQADKPCGEPWPLKAWPDVPTSAVTGRHDRLFPEPLQRSYLRERLGIEPTLIDGGHLVALSNPEGLAKVLQNG